MSSVLHSHVDLKGRKFELVGSLVALLLFVLNYATFIEEPEDETNGADPSYKGEFDEDSIYSCEDAYQRSTRYHGEDPDMDQMRKHRAEDIQKAKDFVDLLKNKESMNAVFQQWIDKLPRKKDGTLHKNRIVELLSLGTFTHYWEDSYKWAGPLVKIRNIDDFKAEIEFSASDTVEKY